MYLYTHRPINNKQLCIKLVGIKKNLRTQSQEKEDFELKNVLVTSSSHEGLEQVHFSQNMDWWWALVSTVKNLHKRPGVFQLADHYLLCGVSPAYMVVKCGFYQMKSAT